MAMEEYHELGTCNLCMKNKATIIYKRKNLFRKQVRELCIECAKIHKKINNDINFNIAK